MSVELFLQWVCLIAIISVSLYFTGLALLDAFFRRKEELIKRIGGIED